MVLSLCVSDVFGPGLLQLFSEIPGCGGFNLDRAISRMLEYPQCTLHKNIVVWPRWASFHRLHRPILPGALVSLILQVGRHQRTRNPTPKAHPVTHIEHSVVGVIGCGHGRFEHAACNMPRCALAHCLATLMFSVWPRGTTSQSKGGINDTPAQLQVCKSL